MNRKPVIGVIGASNPTDSQRKTAFEVGGRVAKEGWTLVNGGLFGVMEASARGAFEAGGVVIGILPGPTAAEANRYVTYPIATNMGYARNVMIAHTADLLVAIGKGEGTLSEIAIGLKLGKKVFGIDTWGIQGVQTEKEVASLLGQLKKAVP